MISNEIIFCQFLRTNGRDARPHRIENDYTKGEIYCFEYRVLRRVVAGKYGFAKFALDMFLFTIQVINNVLYVMRSLKASSWDVKFNNVE